MNVNNDLKDLQQSVNPVERTAAAQPVSQTAPRPASQPEASPAADDRASLSSAASLASQAASASDVRMEKVTAVQQALADGTYSVSAEDVANKMISHMQGK